MWKFTNSRKLLKSLEFGQFSPYTSGGDPFPSVLVVSYYYRGQHPQKFVADAVLYQEVLFVAINGKTEAKA